MKLSKLYFTNKLWSFGRKD